VSPWATAATLVPSRPADEEIVGVFFEGAAFYLMLSENAPNSASI
jgi:hypothetical protein